MLATGEPESAVDVALAAAGVAGGGEAESIGAPVGRDICPVVRGRDRRGSRRSRAPAAPPTASAAPEPEPQPATPQPPKRPTAVRESPRPSPRSRAGSEMALVEIEGTGPNGRIVRRDLDRVTLADARLQRAAAAATGGARGGVRVSPRSPAPGFRRVRGCAARQLRRGDRRAVSLRASQQAPHFYLVADGRIDAPAVAARARSTRAATAKISIDDFVVKAVAGGPCARSPPRTRCGGKTPCGRFSLTWMSRSPLATEGGLRYAGAFDGRADQRLCRGQRDCSSTWQEAPGPASSSQNDSRAEPYRLEPRHVRRPAAAGRPPAVAASAPASSNREVRRPRRDSPALDAVRHLDDRAVHGRRDAEPLALGDDRPLMSSDLAVAALAPVLQHGRRRARRRRSGRTACRASSRRRCLGSARSAAVSPKIGSAACPRAVPDGERLPPGLEHHVAHAGHGDRVEHRQPEARGRHQHARRCSRASSTSRDSMSANALDAPGVTEQLGHAGPPRRIGIRPRTTSARAACAGARCPDRSSSTRPRSPCPRRGRAPTASATASVVMPFCTRGDARRRRRAWGAMSSAAHRVSYAFIEDEDHVERMPQLAPPRTDGSRAARRCSSRSGIRIVEPVAPASPRHGRATARRA